MTLTDFLSGMFRERVAPRLSVRRGASSLVRYAVLGAVALSVLPASAANLPHAAQEKPKRQGGAGSKQSAKRQRQSAAAAPAADNNAKPIPRANVRPFKDLLAKGKALYDAGRLDLTGTLDVSFEADRAEDGTLANVVLTGGSAGNPELMGLSKDFMNAVSESRILSFFENARRVRMSLALGGQNVSATTNIEFDSEERARETAVGYGTLLTFARFKEKGTHAGVVWNSIKVSSSGKQLAFKLEMTREAAGNLLLQQITPN